jgi:putative heme-binding domain-containing protein
MTLRNIPLAIILLAGFTLFGKDPVTSPSAAPVAGGGTHAESFSPGSPVSPITPSGTRPFVQAWNVADFDDVISVGLEGNRDFRNGSRLFSAVSCSACHQFKEYSRAVGPDLSKAGDKFSPRDLLESITDPSREILSPYGQMIFELVDGTLVTGRIVSLSGDTLQVNTDMMRPHELVSVDRKRVRTKTESPVSMMPSGLLNTLSKDDVLDLLAFLLSGGDKDDPLFSD